MSSLVSNVWLEIKRRSQKILICGVYWEFSNLVNKEQMSINEQLEKWKSFQNLHNVRKFVKISTFRYPKIEGKVKKWGQLILVYLIYEAIDNTFMRHIWKAHDQQRILTHKLKSLDFPISNSRSFKNLLCKINTTLLVFHCLQKYQLSNFLWILH